MTDEPRKSMTPEEFKAAGIPQPSTWYLWERLFERIGHKVAPAAPIFRLLITGSREATQPMIECAHHAVERARVHGWEIIVGDAAGVDTEVLIACQRQNVPFTCYGITPWPRTTHGEANYKRIEGGFFARDRAMVDAADRVFVIWDGASDDTEHTFRYAQTQGKQTDVKEFKRE